MSLPTWDHENVRPLRRVLEESKRDGRAIHAGALFYANTYKGEALPEGHPGRGYKSRMVFPGGAVKDQNWDVAMIKALSSAPAAIEAAKFGDLVAPPRQQWPDGRCDAGLYSGVPEGHGNVGRAPRYTRATRVETRSSVRCAGSSEPSMVTQIPVDTGSGIAKNTSAAQASRTWGTRSGGAASGTPSSNSSWPSMSAISSCMGQPRIWPRDGPWYGKDSLLTNLPISRNTSVANIGTAR